MKTLHLVLLTCLTALLINHPLPAHADYKGHHSPGGWGLLSGTQAPTPGSAVVSAFYTRYYADTLRDHDGNQIEPSGTRSDLTSNSPGLFAWWVSNYQILGANWGMSGNAYFTDNVIEHDSFEFDPGYGFADVFVQPVNLGWHLPRADFMVTYGVYIPVGRYDADADDNTGMGMWTHEFGAGTTFYFDAEKKWHISAMAYFEISTEKEDTDIDVGNILTIEGGIGRSWYEGALMVGLAYYGQWKLTHDSVGGLNRTDPLLPSSIDLPKSELYGLGPEVDVPIIINNKLICQITARYQWEFDARSTMEGQMFNLYFNFPL